MAGRTPGDAYRNYIEPMREALHCITQVPITVRENKRLQIDTPYSAALNNMDPVPLRGGVPLHLTVGQTIRIIRTDDPEDIRGPFKVRTIDYFYLLATEADDEILSFQWTPEATAAGVVNAVSFPHLHVGPAMIGEAPAIRPKNLHKAHIPTGRISLEAFIRLAIVEFDVRPLKQDWDTVLQRTETAFMEWKTR